MEIAVYVCDLTEPEEPPKRAKRTKRSLIPRHQRMTAMEKNLKPYEFQRWSELKQNKHLGKRRGSFFPHPGGLLLHEYHVPLPAEATRATNSKSLCMFDDTRKNDLQARGSEKIHLARVSMVD